MADLEQRRNPPWWVLLVAFAALHLGSRLTIEFLYTPGISDIYLPLPLAIAMTYWWGPRIILIMYLNTFINSYYWGHEHVYSWFVFGLPETLSVWMSWLLFVRLGRGKYWLPDLRNLLRFLLLGILLPVTLYAVLIKLVLIAFGELHAQMFSRSVLLTWLGEFMQTVVVSLPILYFASGWLSRKGLTLERGIPVVDRLRAPAKFYPYEMLLAMLAIPLLDFVLDFNLYWYVYGLISLLVAIRHGFGSAVFINFYILAVTYLTPAVFYRQAVSLYFSQTELVNIYLGNILLSVFSVVTGRIHSSYRNAEVTIGHQLDQLRRVNGELDRFVYSVSHDLVAPLKSIRGLAHLLRIDEPTPKSLEYGAMIEDSVRRLEHFIGEILDYSRNSRMEVVFRKTDVVALVSDILEGLRHLPEYHHADVNTSGLKINEIETDPLRLRIILGNLLSNAFKFSAAQPAPRIAIGGACKGGIAEIYVEDNGPGIGQEHQEGIFRMFYRASAHGHGAGLGLYIAREAVRTIGGELTVFSDPGVCTRFTLRLDTARTALSSELTVQDAPSEPQD